MCEQLLHPHQPSDDDGVLLRRSCGRRIKVCDGEQSRLQRWRRLGRHRGVDDLVAASVSAAVAAAAGVHVVVAVAAAAAGALAVAAPCPSLVDGQNLKLGGMTTYDANIEAKIVSAFVAALPTAASGATVVVRSRSFSLKSYMTFAGFTVDTFPDATFKSKCAADLGASRMGP